MHLALRLALQIIKITPLCQGRERLLRPQPGFVAILMVKKKHLSVAFLFFFATTGCSEFHFEPLTPRAFSQADRVEYTRRPGWEEVG